MTASQEIIVSKSREEWAAVINAEWRKSIESIIQTGRDLVQAKAELSHGDYEAMCREDIDFSPEMARGLRGIAEHPEIGKAKGPTDLPPSWSVLASLSELNEGEFKWAKERGLISTKTTLGGARAIAGALKPGDEPVHVGRTQRHLPKPSEARDIARETGRFVAASDGRVYSGATEEEGAEASRVTGQTYGAIDAINLLSKMPEPSQWLTDAPQFQLRDLTAESVEQAATWLLDLVTAMEARQ